MSLNNELPLLDNSALESGNEDSALLCRLHYEQAKNIVLRSYPWAEATRRISLSQDSIGPSFGEYAYSYELPHDFISIQKLNEEDISTDPLINFKIEGHSLLTDESTANLIYTADVEEGYLDALCAECISTLLASKISYQITGNVGRQSELFQMYQQILPLARSINVRSKFEKLPDRRRASTRFLSRRSSTNG